jgi:hypothetical protein
LAKADTAFQAHPLVNTTGEPQAAEGPRAAAGKAVQRLSGPGRHHAPAYVKPYVKRQKNDASDAEAICEAVTRANMRFVSTKTPEQHGGLVLHRARHLFIR